jgi:hypothetical protein
MNVSLHNFAPVFQLFLGIDVCEFVDVVLESPGQANETQFGGADYRLARLAAWQIEPGV